MDNSGFDAAADMARMTAFVSANEASKCIRCDGPGPLVKVTKKGMLKGLCLTCSEKRTATMAADPVSLTERPPRRAVTTIANLLTGPGGHAQVQGADLDHCNQVVSARANLDGCIRDMGAIERHLIVYKNSPYAWTAYERQYAKIEGYAKAIKFHEAKVRENWPALKTLPIHIPQRLEQPEIPKWLTV